MCCVDGGAPAIFGCAALMVTVVNYRGLAFLREFRIIC